MQTLRTVRTMELDNTSLGLGGSPIFRGARYLICFASSLLACGNQELDVVPDTVEAIAVALSSVATQNMLYPTQLTMQRGKVSTQPITALAAQDQSGSGDNWNSYLEFTPATDLQGTFQAKSVHRQQICCSGR